MRFPQASDISGMFMLCATDGTYKKFFQTRILEESFRRGPILVWGVRMAVSEFLRSPARKAKYPPLVYA